MGENLNKRVLIVSQYFWPENFPIIYDLCKELDGKNYKVTVLTGFPNYPDGSLNSNFKLNPSYFSSFGEVEIIRVPIFYRGKSGALRLFVNYLSFVLSAIFIGGWKIRNKLFDVIFVYEPSPITVCLPAIFFKKLRKIPLILWVQDLWPDNLISVNAVRSNIIIEPIRYLVKFIYQSCDLLLGQSRAFCKEFKKYGIDDAQIKYFPNFYSEQDIVALNDNPLINVQDDGQFKILFAGNIGEAQDMPSIVEVGQILKRESMSVKIFIAGSGKKLEWMKKEVEKRDLSEYIKFIGIFPMKDTPALFNKADSLLLSLNDSVAFSKTIPAKLPYYLASSKPILGMINGEAASVINDANCGLTANSGDVDKLIFNIKSLIKMSKNERDLLGLNGLKYARNEFHKEKLIHKLHEWITKII